MESTSRRAFLALAAPLLRAATGKGASSVLSPHHFLDAATEFDLFRLTEQDASAWTPAPNLRWISKRGRFLLHSSNRSGTLQAYRLDWRSGESKQLTDAKALDRSSTVLAADDRSFFYFDGPTLKQSPFSGLKEREVAQVGEGWDRAPGLSLTADSTRAIWIEQRSGRSRVRSVLTQHGEPTTVLETPGLLEDPQIRPGRAQFFYRLSGAPRWSGLDGAADREIQINQAGSMGQALWSPDGKSLLYLWNTPEKATTLREFAPEDGADRLVAKTSQYGSFGINGDASVFVGASRSRAGDYVLLLLRSVRRELTLCEHRAADARMVNPTFSPDSQSIFFVSERQGKPAIFRAHVEKFVEETDEAP